LVASKASESELERSVDNDDSLLACCVSQLRHLATDTRIVLLVPAIIKVDPLALPYQSICTLDKRNLINVKNM